MMHMFTGELDDLARVTRATSTRAENAAVWGLLEMDPAAFQHSHSHLPAKATGPSSTNRFYRRVTISPNRRAHPPTPPTHPPRAIKESCGVSTSPTQRRCRLTLHPWAGEIQLR